MPCILFGWFSKVEGHIYRKSQCLSPFFRKIRAACLRCQRLFSKWHAIRFQQHAHYSDIPDIRFNSQVIALQTMELSESRIEEAVRLKTLYVVAKVLNIYNTIVGIFR